jgi:hypothetical protein
VADFEENAEKRNLNDQRKALMATIKLGDDGATLGVDLQPDPVSLFGKYVLHGGLNEIAAQLSRNLSKRLDGTDPEIRDWDSATTSITFEQPIPLGTSDEELSVGVSGSMSTCKLSSLCDAELYEKVQGLPADTQKYLSMSLRATLSANFNAKAGDLKLGFDAGTDVTLTSSQPANDTDLLLPAVKASLERFMLPADVEDISRMPPLSVASVEGNGSLQLSVELDAPIDPVPLASVPTGILGSSIAVSEAAKLGVKIAPSIRGGYRMQVTKLDNKSALLSYSKKKGATLEVTFTGSVGVSGTAGDTDVVQSFLNAVIPDAKLPENDIRNLGISAAEIGAIASVIQGGIQKSLQVSLQEQLDASTEHGTAFLYRINLTALDAASRLAVSKAIKGDLSLMGGNLAGVSVVRSIVTDTREQSRAFRVNLFGVLNFGSVHDYIQKAEWKQDGDTGDVTLIDTTSASDIGYKINNLDKAQNLRRILADGVLATCIYKASQTGYQPNITADCWAFDLQEKPGRSLILSYGDVAVALGLKGAEAAKQKLLTAQPPFGRTIFNAEIKIDETLFDSLFFDQSGARLLTDYEMIGRQASRQTPPPDVPEEILRVRQDALQDDVLWSQMTAEGDFQHVRALLKDRLGDVWSFDTIANLIYSDYIIIEWWGRAMSNVARPLEDLRIYLKNQTVTDPNSNTLSKLRGNLNKQLTRAIKEVHDQFAEPWGLVGHGSCQRPEGSGQFLDRERHPKGVPVTREVGGCDRSIELMGSHPG